MFSFQISDFGLCISLNTSKSKSNERKKGVCYAESTRLPIKWLAIEALTKHEFSTKSDV